MSTPDNFPQPPAVPAPGHIPTAYPAPPRRPSATLATIALALGATLVVLYLIVKLVAPSINPDYGSDGTNAVATLFGVLGLLAIIPAVGVVVMGHLALRRRPDGTSPGRARAGVALGLGYFLALMWGNRLLIATIVALQAGDFTTFVSDTFWWA